MSTLAADAVFSQQWMMTHYSVERGEPPADLGAWEAIKTPKAWIAMKAIQRVNTMAKAAAGKQFIDDRSADIRSLFGDFIRLRHALVHLTPDIYTETREHLEEESLPDGGGVASVYGKVSSESVVAPGRLPPGGGLRLSTWTQLGDLGPQHLLEACKFALAVLHRAAHVFRILPDNGVYLDSNLVSFRQAFRLLPACSFDADLEKHWGL
jgi:hypothetical protein